MKFKLVHVSDIHFFHACKSPLQFFNRQFMANFNYLFTRKKQFDSNNIYELAKQLKEENITSLVISGDFTCMSSHKEFAKATSLIEHLNKEGFTTYIIPGNHDIYTRKARNTNMFYKKFLGIADFAGDYSFNLEKDKVCGYKLPHNVSLILLDATKFNTLTKANGDFTSLLEINFRKLLSEIPSDSSIIISTHFPYDKYKFPAAHMISGKKLEKLIKSDSRIKLHLHGHRHKARIKKNESHYTVDAGSISNRKKPTYAKIEISEDEITTSINTKGENKHVKKTTTSR